MSEAAWADDEITSDYLGGVLAASSADDDAGASIVAQIGRLSALQLRVHYVIYRELRRLWPDQPLNLYDSKEATKAGLRFTLGDLVAAFGADHVKELRAACAVLVREGLIADTWHLRPDDPERRAETYNLQVKPTGIGAELFLWGHGSPPDASGLFDRSGSLEFLTDVAATPESSLVTPP